MIEMIPIQGPVSLLQLSRLLDLCFDVPQGGRFFDDFPVWEVLNGCETMRCLGFRSDEESWAAGAAARVAQLDLPGGVSVGIIGAVATDPCWRRRGLASRLVEELMRWLTDQGVSLIVLWSSDHAFYRRFGFEPAGNQGVLPLRQMTLPSSTGLRIEKGWSPRLFDCLRRRKGGILLRESDRSWVSAHKNVNWYWLGTEENPLAYAALGRGIDLPGLIHEWGGEPELLMKLFSRIFEENPHAGLLGLPEVLAGFSMKPGVEIETQPLCLARVLDPGLEKMPLWFWGLDSA